MLMFKKGRFHAPGVSFSLPDGSCLETESDQLYEYGFTAWLESRDVWFRMYLDEESDPPTELQDLFAEDVGFIQDSPIEEFEVNGMKSYEVFYHDSKNDHYECCVVVSEDAAMTFYAWCRRGATDNLKELPELREAISSIRKEG